MARFPSSLFTILTALLMIGPWQSSRSEDEKAKTYPRTFKAKGAAVEVVEAPTGIQAAWKTEHFHLLSDQDIGRDALRRFATTMESVPKLLSGYPLPLWSPAKRGRAVIRLCGNEERFSEFGGPSGSAGLFDSRKNEILIRADLFLAPPGSSTRLKEPPDESLLIHEVCHYAMDLKLRGAPPWLKEGLAEYFSVAHQQAGFYRFDQFEQSLPKRLRRNLALQPGARAELPSIKRVLGLDGRAWSRELERGEPEEFYLPYATSLLLVHYYIEGGAARRSEFSDYIQAFSKLQSRRDPLPELPLTDSVAVEDRLTKFWATRGLQLQFEGPVE
ncbi:hypothetical protein [Haloferula sp.]|uniref:hypothetical protein n=1 Tax=Haloferula sp. TaxID=2497595 RepID=UPI00329C0F9E